MLVLNQGSKEGWTSVYIVSMCLATAISMAAFIYIESSIDQPLVDLTLFKNLTFAASNIVGFLSFMALYGGLFLLPFYLRNILGYSAIKAGIALMPLVGSMVVLAPLGGRLATRYGSKIPAALGMGIMTCSLYKFRLLDANTSATYITIWLVVMGIGLALTMSPLSNGVMGVLPKDKLGVGSGVFNLFKNIGGSVGVAVMGTLLDTRQLFHTAVYTNYINSTSEAVNNTLSVLQAGFRQKGFSIAEAKAMALSLMQGMVSKQAAIAAFGDVFLITAVLCSLAILPCLLIQDGKRASK
jgi:predicted MFS family arabinose efflux permease